MNHIIEFIKTADLIPYARNSRTHDDKQIAQIASSIREFGFTNPVLVDNDNGIIAGHGRVLAALKLKIDEVPCIRLSHLTETQKRAYVIADNRIALNSGWDNEMLNLELLDLKQNDFDLSLLGFEDLELDALFGYDEEKTGGLTDDDAIPEPPDEPITKRGDVWLCGNHRVMCGDSTSIDDVETLTLKNTLNLGFSDPPYNLNFDYNKYDDNKSECEYFEFIAKCFANLVICSQRQIITLGTKNIKIAAQLGELTGVACWIKKNWVTGCVIAYLQQWEPIFFYGDFSGFKRNTDLFEINRTYQKDVGGQHSCPKQISLIVDIIESYSNKYDAVVDLFGGSGTTLIACEKTQRTACLMEIDEKYCDVIVKRWQDFTGKKATLESTGEMFGVKTST